MNAKREANGAGLVDGLRAGAAGVPAATPPTDYKMVRDRRARAEVLGDAQPSLAERIGESLAKGTKPVAFGFVLAAGGLPVLPWGSLGGFAAHALQLVLLGWPYRKHPVSIGSVIAITFASVAIGVPSNAAMIGALLIAVRSGYDHSGRAAFLAGSAGVTIVALTPLLAPGDASMLTTADWSAGRAWGEALRTFVFLQSLAFLWGVKRESNERLREVIRLEKERDDAVGEERARIARELHDVVAHHVSLMVIQAQGASSVITKDPTAAQKAIDLVAKTGREALAELRRLLGLLRSQEGDTAEEAEREPQPTIDRIGDLVEGMASAGLTVEVINEGESAPMTQGVELTVYRIVQEALTNVLKHSGASEATVRLSRDAEAIEVEVTDGGGRSRRRRGEAGAGAGLIGMQERIGLFSGRFDAGPVAGGGFRVWARLPLAEVTV
ncbi:MAG TPA: histidine kinase [Acidimicrobiales bacterium]|nr:histidine kinase [Acidimicrobiales bacterium]